MKRNPRFKRAGAVFIFTGVVRSYSKEMENVVAMEIDAYVDLANKIINNICQEIISEHDDVVDVRIIHFTGKFNVSEDLVYVLVASSHRDVGYKAFEKAIERYKTEVPIWKKEIGKEKSRWVPGKTFSKKNL